MIAVRATPFAIDEELAALAFRFYSSVACVQDLKGSGVEEAGLVWPAAESNERRGVSYNGEPLSHPPACPA